MSIRRSNFIIVVFIIVIGGFVMFVDSNPLLNFVLFSFCVFAIVFTLVTAFRWWQSIKI